MIFKRNLLIFLELKFYNIFFHINIFGSSYCYSQNLIAHKAYLKVNLNDRIEKEMGICFMQLDAIKNFVRETSVKWKAPIVQKDCQNVNLLTHFVT